MRTCCSKFQAYWSQGDFWQCVAGNPPLSASFSLGDIESRKCDAVTDISVRRGTQPGRSERRQLWCQQLAGEETVVSGACRTMFEHDDPHRRSVGKTQVAKLAGHLQSALCAGDGAVHAAKYDRRVGSRQHGIRVGTYTRDSAWVLSALGGIVYIGKPGGVSVARVQVFGPLRNCCVTVVNAENG